ncbi:FAD-dependent oxidoreductase [Arthrobacter sp. TES]|uniref:FAD-dependent oxidoreductase n=1 Tax=Paenarthrobacter ureafaciens TaxID=37931 RepID=UPI000397685B|nr:FAD-dependent oxidoreductase [Paenarthrobacter ureafaciens]AOY72330.1 sarcosine oxidase [Arthrobacter sp. ZXY-2]ERI35916.1 FAD-dependent oxidoreductase [Arthrobacter sp. AK-YN10]QOI64021.1 FAD-dependent oxidoreductase [Arthrobacter sp. TES]GLU59352.1 N-methyl-L-tryptophan oxidase [Paenarthrobacter ureafaciens]GLU63620.1 N-methyl-L-tryptophan oxidase [Paenarthrobacter ureafaciens]
MQVDVVVVGGGAMGSAAAWQLSRAGKSVILLEQFEAGHHIGASHGATRNFNTAYAEADYLDLLAESKILWDELAAEHGAPLLDLVGLANHGNTPELQQIHAAHQERGIESYFISPTEAADRWKGMNFPTDVLFVPGSGRVRSADALKALRTSAESKGAVFKYSTPVRDIRVDGPDSVVVVTEEEDYTARRVVVTAGAWTTKVLDGLAELPALVVTQEQPAHFTPVDNTLVWPSFNHNPDPDPNNELYEYWYSPVYGMLTPGEGVKAGWHGVGPVMDPDERTFQPIPQQLEALVRYAEEWLPGVDPSTAVPISCTYTTTPNEDFVLDRFGPLVVGAGFSGHGFKFTPAIGRVLKDIVDGGTAPARFAADR